MSSISSSILSFLAGSSASAGGTTTSNRSSASAATSSPSKQPFQRIDKQTELEIRQQNTKGPQYLNINKRGIFLEVEKDKCTVKYVYSGGQFQDVGSIRSDLPFLGEDVIDYFEIKILQVHPERCSITIGISSLEMVETKQCGWCSDSYGYSSDGKKYHNGRNGKDYSQKFGMGDTIGCGINWITNEIFFTKNGRTLGTAWSNFKSDHLFYPTISLHNKGERVSVQFENTKSIFLFETSLQEMRRKERAKLKTEISRVNISPNTVHVLVQNYLLYTGCIETVKLFENLHHLSPLPNEKELLLLGVHKQKIDNFIATDQFQEAIDYFYSQFYTTKKESMYTSFLLKLSCFHFVNMIQNNKIEEAIQFAANHLSSFFAMKLLEEQESLLEDTIGLLAYSQTILTSHPTCKAVISRITKQDLLEHWSKIMDKEIGNYSDLELVFRSFHLIVEQIRSDSLNGVVKLLQQ